MTTRRDQTPQCSSAPARPHPQLRSASHFLIGAFLVSLSPSLAVAQMSTQPEDPRDTVLRLPVVSSGDVVATALFSFRQGVWPTCPAAVQPPSNNSDTVEIVGPEALRRSDGRPAKRECYADDEGNCYCFGDSSPTGEPPVLLVLSRDVMDGVRALWNGEKIEDTRLHPLDVEEAPAVQRFQAGSLR
ncbi:hypothetical protein [Rubrimonas cliftonensis]|uniref:Uncharacterized protein n=1 Tax=Rubrimonas cliftonensis TaxID=89524 RepID=A0A1H4EJI9_9RHOB|nr:hypothetical protein [Rubrimonas cliftonensis]SEA84412.1 hypothetical protein SAMN05444370_1146 [Rubrimonas cliftonensis]